MPRRDDIASRMAEAVVKRLVGRKLIEIKDEARAREVVRHILSENFLAEEKIEGEVKALLMDHAKLIKDSASDYKRLFSLAKTEGVVIRGFAEEKVRGQLRTEVFRVLEEEGRLEEPVDQEVRKPLSRYSRSVPEGSAEWEILYSKTRDEVFRRRL